MEILGYLASDRTSTVTNLSNLLIPDLTATLPVIGLTSSLILTSWITRLPSADASLSRSDRCSAVTDLQNALIKAGFNPGATDGVFGGATEYAVMRFQEKNQLKNDRIVGQSTATALGLNPNIACPATSATATQTSTSTATPSTTTADSSSGDSSDDDSIAVVSIPVRFGKVTTEGGPLNVRSGPSIDYSVVSTMDNGSAVRFVGQPVGAWLQLVDGGWIHSDWVEFVKAEKTDTPTTSSATQATKADTQAGETSAAQPTASTASSASTTANPSTTSTTANQQAAVGGPATPVSLQDMQVQRLQVKTGGSTLNVRESANYEAKVLNQLEDGAVVTALVPKAQKDLPEWVELSSGGWVASIWLEAQTTIAPQG